MKKTWCLLAVFLLAAVLLTSCNQPAENPEKPSGSQPQVTDPTTPPSDAPEASVTGSVSGFTYFDANCRILNNPALEEPVVFIGSSQDQMQALFSEHFSNDFSEYDESYFATKALAVCFFPTVSADTQIIIQGVQVRDGRLIVTVGKHVPAEPSADTKSPCYLIEIEGGVKTSTLANASVETVAMDRIQLPSGIGTPVTGSVTGFTVWDALTESRRLPTPTYEPQIYAIGSPEEWNAFCYLSERTELLDRYDSDFFNGHSIVIYRRDEPVLQNQVKVLDVQVKEGKLVVTVGRYAPGFGDDAIGHWFLVVEVAGDVVTDEYDDAVLEYLPLDSDPNQDS